MFKILYDDWSMKPCCQSKLLTITFYEILHLGLFSVKGLVTMVYVPIDRE